MYFERFQKESAVGSGFVIHQSVCVFGFLLAEQQREQITGALLEIGVYCGKSAIMLAMQARPEEELILVDWSDFVDHAAVVVHKFKNENVRILKEDSSSNACWALTRDHQRAFRWIHIDGDHKAKTVEDDLRLASQLLAENGILCVDDYFNPRYPQLTFVVNEFLLTESSKFKMFLCGFNKAYITHAGHHRELLRSVHAHLGHGLAARGVSNFTIYKTDFPGSCNSFGIDLRWQKYVYHVLDEDPSRIIY